MSRSCPLFFLVTLLLSGFELSAAGDELTSVRAAIDAYVSAFNRGDAAGVAALWSETGEWINPSGERIVGRDAIQADMKSYFADGSAHIEVVNPRIRVLAPTVAMEEGVVRVTRPSEGVSEASYIAIHVKSDSIWRLDSVRETAVPSQPTNYEHLRELEWMIGTWVDQDENARIETKCEWTKNRNFMTRSFRLEVEGQIDLEGTQVVGYDAANQEIRSWIFDSAGGFGTSTWSRDGDAWIVKNAQTLQDGGRASSVNIIRYVDENTCTWESTGREVDGELLPSIPAVQVVRVDMSAAQTDLQETIEDWSASEAEDNAAPRQVQDSATEDVHVKD